MRVYISVDVEGVAGVVDWDQVRGDSAAYREMCRLTTLETNEAIEGALAAGATEVLVNDSHGPMRNLDAELLHPVAELTQGRHKPMFMVEGIDDSFGALFLVGYHGRAGSAQGTLNHTFSPYETRMNGIICSEATLNAAVAGHYGVPIALVTGDDATAAEAIADFGPEIVTVVTKQGLNRVAARMVHPTVARDRIRQGAEEAMRRAPVTEALYDDDAGDDRDDVEHLAARRYGRDAADRRTYRRPLDPLGLAGCRQRLPHLHRRLPDRPQCGAIGRKMGSTTKTPRTPREGEESE